MFPLTPAVISRSPLFGLFVIACAILIGFGSRGSQTGPVIQGPGTIKVRTQQTAPVVSGVPGGVKVRTLAQTPRVQGVPGGVRVGFSRPQQEAESRDRN